MPYVSTTPAGYRTVTVTHTSTHTVTAMPVATQSRSDVATAEVGDVTNVLTLAGFAISLTGFAFAYVHGLPSGTSIEHWRNLVQKWKAWMHNLPPDMKQRIMQENPTLIQQLDVDLARYFFSQYNPCWSLRRYLMQTRPATRFAPVEVRCSGQEGPLQLEQPSL